MLTNEREVPRLNGGTVVMPSGERLSGKGGDSEPEGHSPRILSHSEGPQKLSKGRWRTPTNVREFAAQANAVATKILNGEVDLDAAKVYGALCRTVAQTVTAETMRARFLKQMPDMGLDSECFED